MAEWVFEWTANDGGTITFTVHRGTGRRVQEVNVNTGELLDSVWAYEATYGYDGKTHEQWCPRPLLVFLRQTIAKQER